MCWFERVAGFSARPSDLIWPCLCLDRTEQVRESGRWVEFQVAKRSPRSANARPLRWVVVRNPRANPHGHSIPFGQEHRSGASWHLASCHSTRISGPLIPSLSFPHALTKVLPARVARAARSWATSQIARRVEHAPRRGTVHSSL